ncbi:hypothetical protein ANANG_G00148810 [Anguilla anguilla]|uniref:Uncharacterized protein n=1 Tax=Anguilla anguilla TaxID=7936 RepID=A0A9D3RU77_ANGAN|nr:hypothetical protein ANANG_G00148810 [Anguilla anguilla]
MPKKWANYFPDQCSKNAVHSGFCSGRRRITVGDILKWIMFRFYTEISVFFCSDFYSVGLEGCIYSKIRWNPVVCLNEFFSFRKSNQVGYYSADGCSKNGAYCGYCFPRTGKGRRRATLPSVRLNFTSGSQTCRVPVPPFQRHALYRVKPKGSFFFF